MKNIYTLMIAVLISANVWAQSPNKMSYQAVIRDANNELVSNAGIGMQISILQGAADGSSVYTETQSPTTNSNGLVTIEIGMGTTSDDFSAIDWAAGPYFVKTETDPSAAGGTNYTITGTSQLMSVPYALYAEKSTPQTLSQNGNEVTLSDGGGSVTITDTQLDEAAVDGFVDNNGYLTVEVDGDATNEIQTISRTGTTVTLSNGGGTFTDSVNVYTAGTGIDITSNVITSSDEPVEDWQTPTLLSNWVNGIGNELGYYKDRGRVYLKGIAKSGSGVIFQLPVGYRPARYQYISTVSNNEFGMILIYSSGQVFMVRGTNNYISLDNLSFRAQ